MSCPRKAPTGTAPGPVLSTVTIPTEASPARATDAMSPTAIAPRLRLPDWRSPRGCRPGSLSSDSSVGLLRSDHIERSPSTLRCGPIRRAPLLPAPMRWCPVPVRPTSTTKGRRTGAPSDTRAWPHTQTDTREGRVSSGPERTRSCRLDHGAHDPVREPPSDQGLPFLFPTWLASWNTEC